MRTDREREIRREREREREIRIERDSERERVVGSALAAAVVLLDVRLGLV